MGALKDFWRKIDAMAEEQRLKIPVWCCWDSDDDDAGYWLYRTMTREEAVAKLRDEMGEKGRDMAISCAPATYSQIEQHQREEERWARAGATRIVSPRLKMEKI